MKVVCLCIVLIAFAIQVNGQGAGHLTPENHPAMSVSFCTKSGCSAQQRSVTLDSNWRWLHANSGATNCYTGNTWDTSLCPDPVTCSKSCVLDGADYSGTYGINTGGNSLSLKFVTHGPYSVNIGSRVYLMSSDPTKYEMFKLLNREFTFDVDVSQLPCGLNGALYFVEMPEDGGRSAYPLNTAGANYGTGYCDAQCPRDMKFINGEANLIDWTPSPNDPNSGTGKYGTCCTEMDIWEANSISSAYTAHPCSVAGQLRCSGVACGDGTDRYNGVCDKDGCDFNSYRMGNKTFFGPRWSGVDTTKKVTVVTQFATNDGTDNGQLAQISRFYVQNGRMIPNSLSVVGGVTPTRNITDNMCVQSKKAFGDYNDFTSKGGLVQTGKALARGMVLVMSLWDDYTAHMLWLDSAYPADKSPSTPGVGRGTCSTSSGVPADVERDSPNATVSFSNIRFGPIGSTTR
eukprot:TRINITY_DN852_c0_g1_i1.p1 TRINITY_DN852_c0_g1~~TRINITY_DN852_c0_g1_i1.p1  ORF type:complete len:476 (+),score=68.86 TRINITY_DN852_c0_g1_i1:52-1428(+)